MLKMPDWLKERRVSVLVILATVAWSAGGAVILLAMLTGRGGLPDAGLWLAGWGGVLTMQKCEQHQVKRERAAFEMGRHIGSDDKVRSL